nr:MAG TPA: SAP domain [Caudoviricetes sp.]
MTKEEVLAKLKELGLDVNGATEEVIQKAQAWLEDQKAQLDTETRRKVRAFWLSVTAVGIVLGIAAGWFGRFMIG